jgi:hypothetical protein
VVLKFSSTLTCQSIIPRFRISFLGETFLVDSLRIRCSRFPQIASASLSLDDGAKSGGRTTIELHKNPSAQSPNRKLIPYLQARIPVIDEIQPAIPQRTAVRFDLCKSERIKGAPVFGGDMDDQSILITPFFECDHLCRKRRHLVGKTSYCCWARVQTTFAKSTSIGPISPKTSIVRKTTSLALEWPI